MFPFKSNTRNGFVSEWERMDNQTDLQISEKHFEFLLIHNGTQLRQVDKYKRTAASWSYSLLQTLEKGFHNSGKFNGIGKLI